MDELRSLVSVAIALPVASGRTFRWQPRAALKAGGGERGGEGGVEGGRRCEGDAAAAAGAPLLPSPKAWPGGQVPAGPPAPFGGGALLSCSSAAIEQRAGPS